MANENKGTVWQQFTRGEWAVRNFAVGTTLAFMLGWGTMLVAAVVFYGRESLIVSGMFDTVGLMIFSTVGVFVGGKLVSGRGLREFLPGKARAPDGDGKTS